MRGWTKAPPDVPCCHMVENSWEVLDAEENEMEAVVICYGSSGGGRILRRV